MTDPAATTASAAAPSAPPAAAGATVFPDLGSSERRRVDGIVEATPLIAVALIAALLGFLVWFADRAEREEAGLALIRDALWVEQALRFQIEADQDAVERMAFDMATRPSETVVVARLRALASTHP